jgi:hypothetical protein
MQFCLFLKLFIICIFTGLDPFGSYVKYSRLYTHRCADKSLVRPGRKQARKHARDARDFNNIETRAAIKAFFLLGKAPKEIHATLIETLACFLPSLAKYLSAPLYLACDCIQPWTLAYVFILRPLRSQQFLNFIILNL